MSAKIHFAKMNAAGNDFVIIDARNQKIELSKQYIATICNRKNIGCDQLIVINNSIKAYCLLTIYNADGSLSGACGNATRCVAALMMQESNPQEIIIETAAGLLKCWSNTDDKIISVAMGIPIFQNDFHFDGFNFYCMDIGNPHAVSFVSEIPKDDIFFKIGSEVEKNNFFPHKTNVEFAKIIYDNLIEVRVFERGAGETLACGSGACAVAVIAMKQNLINSKKTIIRFKGGDLLIEWNGEGSSVVMSGGYNKIYDGVIDEYFL
jgi:diaminopimelate epimerase